MSFAGDAIATTVISAEVVTNTAQIDAAARDAASRIDKTFQQGLKTGSDKTNAAFDRMGQKIRTTTTNIQAGFTTLGQVIAARLPAQVTTAANAISSRMGSALGSVRASFGQLQSAASRTWSVVGSGAQAAAIAVGALIGIAAAVGAQFAAIADETRQAELGTRALAASVGLSDAQVSGLISSLRGLGAELGFNSNELITTSQRFIAMGATAEQSARTLEAVATGAARAGATQAQMSRVLVGLQQVQAKGVLSQEEFRRQILENIPGLLNQNRAFELMGEALGVTTQRARELQEEGKITADVAIPAITQAIEEMNSGVDVLALRMQTLGGVTAILRENFRQIVGTAFQPFIEALLPTIKGFIDAVKSGDGPIKSLRSDIERFGKVLGESLGKVLQDLVPLIGQTFHVFVTAVEAFAPVIVDLISSFATLGRIVLPVLNVLANAFKILFTQLGPVSTLLRALAGGALLGGLVKAFGLFGRAVGSIGGFLGRIATPLSSFLAKLGSLSGVVAGATAAFGLLRGPIEDFIGLIQSAIGVVGRFIGMIGRLPGIKQLVNIVGDVGGAIGDFVSGLGDAEEETDDVGKAVQKVTPKITGLTSVFDSLNSVLEETVNKQEDLISAQEAVKDAEQGLIDANQALAQANLDLIAATEDLAEAEQSLLDIDAELAEATAERAELVADVGRDIRELARAERDLERINLRLLDIDEERADILEEIAELQAPATAEELAAIDRKIERGKIALSKAIREETEFLRELNAEQQTSIDLSSLSLDDLRTTLSGLRAQAAAQRTVGRSVRSQEEINEEIAENRLSVLEAEADLNELIGEREELNNRALLNAEEIEDLTDRLYRIELDREDVLLDQADAILALDALRRGETERAKEIEQVDERIKRLTEQRRDAVIQIRDAGFAIRDTENQIKIANDGIKQANLDIRDAKITQRQKTAEILGDERAINNALLDRISFNSTLLGQGAGLARNTLIQTLLGSPEILNSLISTLNPTGGLPRGGRDPDDPRPTAGSVPRITAQDIADMILNNPNALRDLLRQLGISGFSEGGLITHPTLAAMGEWSKHEVVLPLSKPDRVWSLLSQHLPKYPGALRAAQSALAGPERGGLPKVVSSGNRVVNRADGPATYGQLQELINLLRETKFEQHVEAPITVNTQKVDEDLLARKMSRRIERDVLDKLSRR